MISHIDLMQSAFVCQPLGCTLSEEQLHSLQKHSAAAWQDFKDDMTKFETSWKSVQLSTFEEYRHVFASCNEPEETEFIKNKMKETLSHIKRKYHYLEQSQFKTRLSQISTKTSELSTMIDVQASFRAHVEVSSKRIIQKFLIEPTEFL